MACLPYFQLILIKKVFFAGFFVLLKINKFERMYRNMTYESFKIAVTAEVTNMVGEEVDVSLHKVPKNNGIVMDAITVMPYGSHIAPTIYLKDYFQRYENGASVKEIAQEVIKFSLDHQISKIIPEGFFMEYTQVKKRICFKLINYEKNKFLLDEIPFRKLLDLAVVFYYAVEPELLGHATVLVRNMDMERWGITMERLWRDAVENTPNLLPWRFTSVQRIVNNLMFDGPEKALEEIGSSCEIVQEDMEEVPMYILTNKEKYFGAACILYPSLLPSIAEKFNSSLYILPSSIHECIIMPVSGCYTKESLSEMVREINEREVEDIEILSDHAYFYDRHLNALQM